MTFASETLKKYVSGAFKLFLIILPWQTLYIVRAGIIPMESIVIHLSALFLSVIVGLALYIYKPKINFKILSFVGLILILQIINASDSLLALQQIVWLFLGGGLWWLFSKDILAKSEQINYLIIGAIGPTLLGLWQFFSQTSLTAALLGLSYIPANLPGSPIIVNESGRWLRAFGSFPHPNIFGGYLVAILVLIFSCANEYIISNKNNWTLRLVIVLFTAALIFTFSRSALCVWILFMIFYHYKIFKTERGSEMAICIFISLLTAILALTLTWSIWNGRLGQGNLSQNETTSISDRVSGNYSAVKIIKDNWFIGVGPGNYTQTLHKAMPELKPWELAPVHNVPLLILAEWGLAGLIILGLLLYYLRAKTLYLFPILLLDHYFYSQWPGILVGVILILSTVYAHLRLTQPK